MSSQKYTDVVVTIKDRIGTIKLNRPKALNSFGGNLMIDVVAALRELDNHPDTVFTVLTGEGRFFSSGADVLAVGARSTVEHPNDAAKKVAFLSGHATAVELLRSIIDHRKVFVLALNGPAVGGGAAWFTGVSDIVLASDSCWLQITFSALGLVPEFGSAINIGQSMGIHRANEFLMMGRKLTAQELETFGIANQVFNSTGEKFQSDVREYLVEKLNRNDGKSMMEAKRLMNAPLRDGRLVAVVNAADALAEAFVEGRPEKRFALKRKELEEKSKGKSKL